MAIFTVTNLNDNGAGSLREAIGLANATVGDADTIQFAVNGTIRLTTGTLDVTDALTIDGGTTGILITGDALGDDVTPLGDITDLALSALTLADNVRIFDTTANVTLFGLTLTGGVAGLGEDGGAVRGGVGVTITLTNSTLSGNSGDNGGGIFADTTILTNVTLSGNSAADDGGGIYATTATVRNSTISGNLAGPTGTDEGGGIYATTINLNNSIVLGNSAGAFDEIFGTTNLSGGNIVGNGLGGANVFSGSTNVGDTDADEVFANTVDIGGGIVAGVLADNGGRVETIALRALATNPAIDASDFIALTQDARGENGVEQLGTPNVNGDERDLGAYELGLIDSTWNGGSGNYHAGGNWNPFNTPPIGTGFFGTAPTTSIDIMASTTLGAWLFNAGADDYDFSVAAVSVTFIGAGLIITDNAVAIDNDGLLTFENASTAANATITNNSGGQVLFDNTSTAGSAEIINNSGGVVSFDINSTASDANITNGGTVVFNFDSSAANATIVNNNVLLFSAGGSAGNSDITNNFDLTFDGTGTAGSADITNNSQLTFNDTGTASTATITTTNGATTLFNNNSTGGNAEFITELGGEVDFSGSSGPISDNTLTAGSIAGDGDYNLGGNKLTVGSNNLSTVVGGIIAGTGGPLVKTGTGILTLANANTYSGGTRIEEGTLRIGNGGATGSIIGDVITEADGILAFNRSDEFTFTGTISGDGTVAQDGSGTLVFGGPQSHTGGTVVNDGTLRLTGTGFIGSATVNSGGTLEGSAQVGTATVNAGGMLAPGISAGTYNFAIGSLLLSAGATVAMEIGGLLPGPAGHDQITSSNIVQLGGATLDASLIGPFDPSTTSNTDFVILNNSGVNAVDGTFAGLAEGAEFNFSGRLFNISYQGGNGNDVVLTNAGAFVTGTAGADIVDGANSPGGEHEATNLRDIIFGLDGNDQLSGLGGSDTLIGGLGKDTMAGGDDADIFDFNFKTESRKGGARDVITDFSGVSGGELDDIDLSGVDAKTGSGNQAFKWIGKAKFHDKKGELHYVKKAGFVIVEGDINGDGRADFQIAVQGVNALAKADFIL
jgi:fibronectin-binding autotransporter adhesin